jgi:hypothetical protein
MLPLYSTGREPLSKKEKKGKQNTRMFSVRYPSTLSFDINIRYYCERFILMLTLIPD